MAANGLYFTSFLLIFIVFAVSTSSTSSVEWDSWKIIHNKYYSTVDEEVKRYQIWKTNAQYIYEHNSNISKYGYTLGMNEFGDMESKEFSHFYNGYLMMSQGDNDENGNIFNPITNSSLPVTMDWRDKKIITPVKNQGKCGSCWSFSTTGCLEGLHALKTNNLISLSEQQLLDCSTKYGNYGCDGGQMRAAFQYIKDNGGDDTEASYPYTAKNETCRFNPKTIGATDNGYVRIPSGDEVALMKAVGSIGPISVAMDASLKSFQFYKKGIYSDFSCANDIRYLNHGVLAIGYGELNSNPYWLVKNSWGTSWGMDGYFMLARFIGNMCGIACDASYPIV